MAVEIGGSHFSVVVDGRWSMVEIGARVYRIGNSQQELPFSTANPIGSALGNSE